jgi:general secretion pathway protein C
LSDDHNMRIVASVLASQRPRGELLASLLTRAPQWVAGALVIAIGVQLAVVVADLSGGKAPPTTAPVDMQPAPQRSMIDVASLRAAQLFGAAPATNANASNAPVTTMALVLVGVLAADDPAQGFALLGPSANAAKLYAGGSAVPGGARLAGIYNDRVVLDRGGQLETLPMPRQRSNVTVAMPPPVAAGPSAVERLGRMASENPGLIGRVIQAQAVLSNGQQRGYRVFPAANQEGIFTKLGLRSGDLVTHINGTPLDDPQRGAEIFSTLSSAADARLTVVRNGRPTDVSLNLAEMARQVEQINAAPPPDGGAGPNPPAPRPTE